MGTVKETDLKIFERLKISASSNIFFSLKYQMLITEFLSILIIEFLKICGMQFYDLNNFLDVFIVQKTDFVNWSESFESMEKNSNNLILLGVAIAFGFLTVGGIIYFGSVKETVDLDLPSFLFYQHLVEFSKNYELWFKMLMEQQNLLNDANFGYNKFNINDQFNVRRRLLYLELLQFSLHHQTEILRFDLIELLEHYNKLLQFHNYEQINHLISKKLSFDKNKMLFTDIFSLNKEIDSRYNEYCHQLNNLKKSIS